jgi:hypothetical protein
VTALLNLVTFLVTFLKIVKQGTLLKLRKLSIYLGFAGLAQLVEQLTLNHILQPLFSLLIKDLQNQFVSQNAIRCQNLVTFWSPFFYDTE